MSAKPPVQSDRFNAAYTNLLRRLPRTFNGAPGSLAAAAEALRMAHGA